MQQRNSDLGEGGHVCPQSAQGVVQNITFPRHRHDRHRVLFRTTPFLGAAMIGTGCCSEQHLS
ncbi:hypothetical protein THI_1444 [Thiomonas arsenitoxydans]|uniref:Uncharacterized protein n=1 Tax=Thiomonas arsenitoxydans (strain DSM 22701 / CIP 110005 / 3As) TaxID=426114 RepID=D6CQ48_THIA3|nr:hypothetical protein THI_1444 [Thiomonas arsenitoxydans]